MTDWAEVSRAVEQYVLFFRNDYAMPPPEIRLTRDQLETVREVIPTVDVRDCPGALMYGVPVVLVDSIEDSILWQRAVERQAAMYRKVK